MKPFSHHLKSTLYVVIAIGILAAVFPHGLLAFYSLAYNEEDVPAISTPHIEAKVQPWQIATLGMPTYDLPLSLELQEYTYEQCQKKNIEYALALAVMKVESDFDPREVSYNHSSKGIMQLNVNNTAKWLSEKNHIKKFDVFNPYHNIQCGIWYLDYLRSYWTDQGISDEATLYRCVLGSYNMGTTEYTQYTQKTGTYETNYTEKVLLYKEQLETEGKITE